MNMLLLSAAEGPLIDWSFTSGSLPSSAVFSRASSGLCLGASGLLETCSEDRPRFDTGSSSGLLLEGQRTNLCPASVIDSGATGWSATGSWPNWQSVISAPNGSASFISVSDIATSGLHYIGAGNAAFAANTVYTASVYAKKNTASVLQITFPLMSFTNTCYANFNLQTGTIVQVGAGCTARIEAIGNGVYRCSITATSSTAGSSFAIICGFTNGVDVSGRLPTYTGTNKEIYLWGAQTEEGAYPTSYIPTNGSIATRAADLLTISTLPWLNAEQGTLFAVYDALGAASTDMPRIASFNNNGSSEISLAINGSTAKTYGVISNGTETFSEGAGAFANGTVIKAAMAFSSKRALCAAQGVLSAQDTAITLPGGLTRLTFFRRNEASPTLFGCGHLRRFCYWNRILSDNELQRMTQ